VSNAKFQSDKGKINVEWEQAAKRNKECEELKDEQGSHRHGTAGSAFAKAHHLSLIDSVEHVERRFTSTFRKSKMFLSNKG
jgi:hypothetical protein